MRSSGCRHPATSYATPSSERAGKASLDHQVHARSQLQDRLRRAHCRGVLRCSIEPLGDLHPPLDVHIDRGHRFFFLALRLAPDAWAVLGAARVHLGDLEEAADAMGRAVALAPEARSYGRMLERIDRVAQRYRDDQPRWRSTEFLRWTVGRGRPASWSMRQAQQRDESAGEAGLVAAAVVVGVAIVVIAITLGFETSDGRGRPWWE